MKENSEITEMFVGPIRSVIGKSIAKIRCQDDLKYWEIEMDNGDVLYWDRLTTGGFFGRVVENVSSSPALVAGNESTLGENISPLPASGAAPCSAPSLWRGLWDWESRGLDNGIGWSAFGFLILCCFFQFIIWFGIVAGSQRPDVWPVWRSWVMGIGSVYMFVEMLNLGRCLWGGKNRVKTRNNAND